MSRTYKIKRLNEFLDCSQGKDMLDAFYQKFLKTLKYAPQGMMEDTKVARFSSKLNSPLDTRLQSLRLTMFAELLDAGTPIEQELKQIHPNPPKESRGNIKEGQPREASFQESNNNQGQFNH